MLWPTRINSLQRWSTRVVPAACLDHGCHPSGQCPPRRLSDMSRAQISALVFGVGGFGALVAATTSNQWKVTTRASSVITATWVYQGLWMNCAGNALGSFHCRPHFTIFKVEGKYNSFVWGGSKMSLFPSRRSSVCVQSAVSWVLDPQRQDLPKMDDVCECWLKELNHAFYMAKEN